MPGRGEEIARVQNVIAQKLPGSAVQLVGAVLADYVQMDTEPGAILRRIGPGLNLKLGDCVDGGPQRCGGDQIRDDAHAVERNTILHFARASANKILTAGGVSAGPALHAREHTGVSAAARSTSRPFRGMSARVF